MLSALTTLGWQDATALCFVLAAAVYLLRRALGTTRARKRIGCGHCCACRRPTA